MGAKLPVKAISFDPEGLDSRLAKALEKLPRSADGVTVQIKLTGAEGEGYQLRMQPESITVEAQGPAGAFYGIQTLR